MRRVIVYKDVFNKDKKEYERLAMYKAKFLKFGCDMVEFENGAGNYSTAIIEKDNGDVCNVPVDQISFIKPKHRKVKFIWK